MFPYFSFPTSTSFFPIFGVFSLLDVVDKILQRKHKHTHNPLALRNIINTRRPTKWKLINEWAEGSRKMLDDDGLFGLSVKKITRKRKAPTI